MTDPITLNIEPNEFRRWLFAHRWEPVGYAGNNANCPLARYLSERRGQNVEVDRWAAVIGGGVQVALPAWAGDFVIGVDRTRDGLDDSAWDVPLTGCEALMVLDFTLYHSRVLDGEDRVHGWTDAQGDIVQ